MRTKLTTICLLVGLTSLAFGQNGALDPDFGVGGMVITSFTSGSDHINSIAIQEDGKIVSAGFASSAKGWDYAVLRTNPDGSPDNTFGTGGKVTTAIGTQYDNAYSVVMQTDGKIIVAGYISPLNNPDEDIVLVRYNPDGSLDSTFGINGIVQTAVGYDADECRGLVIEPNGKIVVVGSTHFTNEWDLLVVRYNPEGSLDYTFGYQGKTTVFFGSADDFGTAILRQPDGKIVVGGVTDSGTTYDFALARFDTNGVLDNSFGNGGKVITDIRDTDDECYTLALQTNGKILAAGYTENGYGHQQDFSVVRYNTDGTLDDSFGTGGKVITTISTEIDEAQSITLQPDGKILVAGFAKIDGFVNSALVRYNTNGTPDDTFGNSGIVITAAGTSCSSTAVRMQSDGKIVTGGYSYGSSSDFLLMRYLSGLIVGLNEACNKDEFLTISPNPFQTQTTVSYTLKENSHVVLQVYDINGRLLSSLVSDEKQPGNYSQCLWLGNIPAGTYFCRLVINNKSTIAKMIKTEN